MQSPMDYLAEMVVSKLSNGFEGFLLDFITAFPILIGISLAVYALCGMISETLAKLGIGCVFVYGALIIII